jgi:hypothetical protein
MSTNKRTPLNEQMAVGTRKRLHPAFALTLGGVGILGSLATGCGPSSTADVKPSGTVTSANSGGGNAPVRVRSFSDSRPVKSLAAAAGLVWVGTPRGLVRWSTTSEPPTPAVLTTIDGLPADRIEGIALDLKGGVWVTTSKGVGHFASGSWTKYPKAPVGDLVTGIVVTPDADNVWVGGSDGLARLKEGQWERYAAGTTVTALVHDGGTGVWIGTSGKGIMRVVKQDMLQFGMAEGNDIDNVRAMVADSNGSLLAVGDGPGGQRVAFYDGSRFWSYRVDNSNVIEWVQRVGADLFLGAGQSVWTMKRVATPAEIRGPVKFTYSGSPALGAPKAQPLASLLVKEVAPPPPPPPVAAPPPPPDAGKGKSKKDKAGKKTSALFAPQADQLAECNAGTGSGNPCEAGPSVARRWPRWFRWSRAAVRHRCRRCSAARWHHDRLS